MVSRTSGHQNTGTTGAFCAATISTFFTQRRCAVRSFVRTETGRPGITNS